MQATQVSKALVLILVILSVLLNACNKKGNGRSAQDPRTFSLCQLKQDPTAYDGYFVRVSGWIGTDIHAETLLAEGCGVELFRPDDEDRLSRVDTEYARFRALLAREKAGTWFTNQTLFSVIEGRFETSLVKRDGKVVPRDASVALGGNLALKVTRVLCTSEIPVGNASLQSAESTCLSQVGKNH